MGFPEGKLKELLLACARAVEEDQEKDRGAIDKMIAELSSMVSSSVEPFERLGAYMLEGLIARRRSSSGNSILKSLNGREAVLPDLPSYMHCLNEACPYFRSGYMAANHEILIAAHGEARIHIIDFSISDGSQWVSLLQRISWRPGGPPNVRITGIDDKVSPEARHSQLKTTERRLSHMAALFAVPFQFHAVAVSSSEVGEGHLGVIPRARHTGGSDVEEGNKEEREEALMVNFNLELHRIPDKTVGTANHRDRVLRLVKSLLPKLVTLVEQELDTNTGPFPQRFVEMLDYYTAVFESISVNCTKDKSILYYYYTTVFKSIDPRDDNSRRIGLEQQCLAREIINLVAYEGAERVERHELFAKWKPRLMMAGFTPSPVTSCGNVDAIKVMLQEYSPCYLCEERDGALYLGWKDRPLLVMSAWH